MDFKNKVGKYEKESKLYIENKRNWDNIANNLGK